MAGSSDLSHVSRNELIGNVVQAIAHDLCRGRDRRTEISAGWTRNVLLLP